MTSATFQKTHGLLACMLMTLSSISQCWMKATMTLEPTYLPAQFVIGNKAYFPCGWANGNHSNSTYVYDASVDQWSKTSDFGGAQRLDAHGFSIGNKGYVVFGELPNGAEYNEVWEYNAATAAWTKKNDMPGKFREWPFTLSIGGKGYTGTGRKAGNPERGTDFWSYDPASDSWTQLPDVPGTGRMAALALTINGKAYIGLGELNVYPWTPLNDFYEYDPLTNTWDTLNSPPFSGAAFTSFDIQNSGYVHRNNVGFWHYNPSNDTWSQLPNCIPHNGLLMNGFTINNKGYIAFGQGNNWYLPNQLFQYNPPGITDVEESQVHTLNVFPNPVDELLYFDTDLPDNTEITVYDGCGRLVLKSQISSGSANMSALQAGIYSLVIRDHKGISNTRFVKRD